MKFSKGILVGCAALGVLAGCKEKTESVQVRERIEGSTWVVRDSVVESFLEATGTATPRLSADLSTRLMGKVLAVDVQEGALVREGQVLLRIDGRDLDARAEGIESGLSASRSQLALAEVQARRMRALHGDSAVPKSVLDQAEAELDRAKAGLSQLRSQETELRTAQDYSRIVAPFSGKVVARRADPGMMAAPGVPLLRVEDAGILRVSASTTTSTAAGLKRGQILKARIDGRSVDARIEGVVPSGTGNLATVNALVDNGRDSLPSGAVATLLVPRGTRSVRLAPVAALQREGDLTGLWVRGPEGDVKRWIKVGTEFGGFVEAMSGLGVGDTVVVPASRVAGN